MKTAVRLRFFFPISFCVKSLDNLFDLPLTKNPNKHKPINTSGIKKKALYCKENIKADFKDLPAEKKRSFQKIT